MQVQNYDWIPNQVGNDGEGQIGLRAKSRPMLTFSGLFRRRRGFVQPCVSTKTFWLVHSLF